MQISMLYTSSSHWSDVLQLWFEMCKNVSIGYQQLKMKNICVSTKKMKSVELYLKPN